jgi:hypothetical protein
LKRESLAVTLFIALSVVALSQSVDSFFASANWVGAMPLEIEISPQSVGANPPTITFLSPENGKTYGSNLTLHCKISLGDVTLRNMSTRIEKLYYQEDWEKSNTIITNSMALRPVPQWNEETHTWETIIVNVDFNLTEFSTDLKVPTEGNHSITVWADEAGSYLEDTGKKINGLEKINIYTFHVTSFKTVTFMVDNSPPVEQPTSTQIAPTINTGSMLPVELNPTIPYIIFAVVIAIVAVAFFSSVYFKRRSGKQ